MTKQAAEAARERRAVGGSASNYVVRFHGQDLVHVSSKLQARIWAEQLSVREDNEQVQR